jgi:hypothetical protein
MSSLGIRNTALDYLSRGWSVVPIRHRNKRPLIRWEAFQHRRPSREEVSDWFERWPDANLGVVTGCVSGLVVLDVDPDHGGDESLRRLVGRHGPLPVTVEAVTGGGGRHLYFVHPGGLVRNKVGLAPGIDLRGDGGLVVSPPSVHASGHRYTWATGADPACVPLAPLPGWILREAVGGDGPVGHPLDYWRALLREGVPAGQRNNTVASIAGHLLWHGVDPEVVLELLLCWNTVRCRPPLPDEEVINTLQSITRLHQRRGEDVGG